jgi:RNA polymerase sigma-70 factor (ECF subfamily)
MSDATNEPPEPTEEPMAVVGQSRVVKPLRTTDVDDPALLDRCRALDPDALERVFRECSPAIERLLRRMVGPSHDIDDLLQSTFVSSMGTFKNFRGEASVRTWMCRIAVRTAIDQMRKPDHKRRHLALLEEPTDETTDRDRAREIFGRQCLARMYEHMEALSAEKRAAFVLHVFEGHPLEEVAALTGSSRAATKSRVFWARRMLLSRARRDPLLREFLEAM